MSYFLKCIVMGARKYPYYLVYKQTKWQNITISSNFIKIRARVAHTASISSPSFLS